MQTYPLRTRIGPYEIASRPMMGGMGIVYFALDHGNDGRPVALKTFRPELLPNRAARDRFLREGTAWVELGSHPHIVRCYKVEYIDPTAFLVLELIAKEQNMPDASLRSWLIPGQPLPIEQALLFALQIARGMQYSTEKIPGFVHRDLKPENILVGADKLPGTNINRLRVTDFGLVKTITSSDTLSKAGNEEELKPNQVQFTLGAGTPIYMAPEQWQGESVGIFTDIYAFGCILYEILSGKPAAKGETIIDLQRAHCEGRLNPIPPNIPVDEAELIVKCTVGKPTNRHKSWSAITDILENRLISNFGRSVLLKVESSDVDVEDRAQEGWSYNSMGYAYLDMGKAEIAANYFEHSLAIAQDCGDRRGESAAMGNLGSAYYQLGDARRAIKYHERELIISREINDKREAGIALGNLGLAYAALGENQKAVELYQQQLSISREVGDRRVEGIALGNLGLTYADLGDTRRAVDCYEKRLAIAREVGDNRGQGNALGNLGLAFLDLGKPQEAISYLTQALTIQRQVGDRRGEGSALNNLGNAFGDLGDNQMAIMYYEQSLAITREIGNRIGEGNALGNLGSTYLEMGDVHKAITFLDLRLTIAREIGDRLGEGNSLANLANAHGQLRESEKTINYYYQALSIWREIGHLNGQASVSYNIALFYEKHGDLLRAIPFAQEAVQSWLKTGNPKSQMAQSLLERLKRGKPRPDTPAQEAFEAFQRVQSFEEMRAISFRYPVMIDSRFIQGVELAIREQVPLYLKPEMEQRLTWLRRVAKK